MQLATKLSTANGLELASASVNLQASQGTLLCDPVKCGRECHDLTGNRDLRNLSACRQAPAHILAHVVSVDLWCVLGYNRPDWGEHQLMITATQGV